MHPVDRIRTVVRPIALGLRRLSLRARLLLGLVLLATLGLVVANFVVYDEIQSYLIGQIDQQLRTALTPFTSALPSSPFGSSFGSQYNFGQFTPPGTYGVVLNSNGQILFQANRRSLRGNGPPVPSRFISAIIQGPDQQGAVTGGTTAEYFTASAIGQPSFQYRVIGIPAVATTGNSNTVVAAFVATPQNALNSTLSQFVRIALLASGAVILALGLIGMAVVRIGLRPLPHAIEETAGAIAAGNLSRRVDDDDPRTEVGRLGGSLNAMLGQIENAFDEQQASENQLRQFLADASHELRTPVTSIRGYSELYRRGAVSTPEELSLSMRRIEDEAIRMGVLVDDLLLLARLDQGRPLERGPVDFAELAIDAAADAQVRSPDRAISVDAPDPVIVQGDEQRLRQVVANLVQNALVHTPEGTPITVQVRSEGDIANLAVHDEGPGIAPEHLEHIFERFYRADPSRARSSGGSGLGLSIVASIAAAHGGAARVESTTGHGSTFVVELPISTESDEVVPIAISVTNSGDVEGPTARQATTVSADAVSPVEDPSGVS